jgi:hypothetical protein
MILNKSGDWHLALINNLRVFRSLKIDQKIFPLQNRQKLIKID